MPFDDYYGNRSTVDLLIAMMARNRLPHAILLSGPAGIGKYTLAQMLAKSVHCQDREHDFCASCRNCRLIGMADDRIAVTQIAEQERESATRKPREMPLVIQNHPDVVLLPPNGPLRLFQIEQARYLKQALTFLPSAGDKKIFILPDVERMDSAAANSLLKSLEEPPSHVLLLLTTSNDASLLPTIRSRCVSFALSELTREQIMAILEKSGPKESAKDQLLRASLARGCPGRALRLDLESHLRLRDSLMTILEAGAAANNFSLLFTEVRKIAGEKEGLENLLSVLYSLLQDILHLEARSDGEPLRNSDSPKQLLKLAQIIGVDGVKRAAAALNQVERNLRRNIPIQISLEAFAISLAPQRRMSETLELKNS
ncbi:MAG: hypothetical protein A3F68_07185 [Acidobacteria bacterium RIFCSPLOWO2_12_FULL_54_10]|nr:MAG: hypothetical protein A3F68_07185 [Acidobacteria bacterium RIFCSPLOWO2_12_FULL_54_10]